jgi:hypothetical protein
LPASGLRSGESKGLFEVNNLALLDDIDALLADWSPGSAVQFLEGEHDIVRRLLKNPDLQSVRNAVL